MADWINGEPLIATADHLAARWGGDPANFRCGFCGQRILAGERWCFVYTNDLVGAGGNPLACQVCIDAANFRVTDQTGTGTLRDVLRSTWASRCAEWREFTRDPRWWRFVRNMWAEVEQEGGDG